MQWEEQRNFTNPVRLGFNPDKLDGDYKKIFSDTIARTLYLALGCGHLRDQTFAPRCLKAAETIRSKGTPQTAAEMQEFIRKKFGSGYNASMGAEILPYLNGERLLGYEFDPTEREAPTLPENILISIKKERNLSGQIRVEVYRMEGANGSRRVNHLGDIGVSDDFHPIGTRPTLVSIVKKVTELSNH